MSAATAHDAHHEHHDEHHHHGPEPGVLRWVFTTNHKDIGTLYLVFSFLMLLLGGALALAIRAELWSPGLQFVEPDFFNQLTTMHALIMVFGAIMPAHRGLRELDDPDDDRGAGHGLAAHEQLELLAPSVRVRAPARHLLHGGRRPRPRAGPLYPPLVLQGGANLPFAIFAIHLMGISSVMGSINIIVTILNMRAPGMTLLKMPLFVWTWFITAFLLVAAMPVFAGAVTMLLTDKFFGTTFFSAAGGGDPVLFQHIFWFFGHPEVYIMILPSFGIVSQVIPTFSRKPLFGYESMVYATASIAFLSFLVWAHHMFTVGMPLAGELFFMYTTMLIAVPTGVKVFNWVATMWRGSMTFETPMLYAISFVILFTIGGFSGLMLAIVPSDFQYHDTYFVVAHFHYVLVTGALFGIFAGGLLLAPEVDRQHVRRAARQVALLAVHHLRQHPVLPAALPRAGRDAAADPGLCGPVRRLEHGVEHRRLRVRDRAAPVRLDRAQVLPGRKAGDRRGVGRLGRAGMDRVLASSVSHLREPAGRPLGQLLARRRR